MSVLPRPSSDLPPEAPPRDARRRAQRFFVLWAVGASAGMDSGLLALLHWAGAVPLAAALWCAAGGVLLCGLSWWIFRSGWNLRQADPYLALPQLAGWSALQVAIAWHWQAVALPVLAVIFIVFAFAALRLSPRQLLTAWLGCSAGIGAVVLHWQGDLSLPHGSAAAATLSTLWIALVLGRCAFVGQYGALVRKQLGLRNRELADATDRLHQLATRDALTGALNRRAILDLLAMALSQGPAAVVLVDLDHFKQVNDRHGHGTGDEVLRRFVRAATQALRSTDRLGRYGGEEFLLVIPGADTADVAQAVAERLREATAAQDWSDLAAGLRITASAGVAAARPGEPVEALVRRADAALYAAKQAGRDSVRLAA